MKIFCINLPKSVERKEVINQQFSSMELTGVEWIEAIDGRAMLEEDILAANDFQYQERSNNRHFFPGEIGCVLSHHKAYQKLLEQNVECALVLEDDAKMDVAICEIFESLEEEMKSAVPKILLLTHAKSYFIKDKRKINGRTLVDVARARGGYGYIINRSAAKVLLEINTPIRHVADDWKRVIFLSGRKVKFQAIIPPLITHNFTGNKSDIIVTQTEKDRNLGKKRESNKLRSNIYNLPMKISLWYFRLFRKVK